MAMLLAFFFFFFFFEGGEGGGVMFHKSIVKLISILCVILHI